MLPPAIGLHGERGQCVKRLYHRPILPAPESIHFNSCLIRFEFKILRFRGG